MEYVYGTVCHVCKYRGLVGKCAECRPSNFEVENGGE